MSLAESALEAMEQPRRTEGAAFMYLYVLGALVVGILPILLGRLASEGHVDVTQMGRAAAAELLAMGLTSTLAGLSLPARHLRVTATLAALLLAAMNLLSIGVRGDAFVVVRALAGMQSGVLLWIAAGWLARTPKPERWASIFILALGCGQLAMGELLTQALPRFGIAGGFIIVAAATLVAAAVALTIPNSGVAVSAEQTGTMPQSTGWVSLASIFLYFAFLIVITTYTLPLAAEKGYPSNIGERAVVANLIGQLAGGCVAIWATRRFNWFPVLGAAVVICLGLVYALGTAMSPKMFVMLNGFLGFVPMLAMAFHMPFAVAADPSRRSAVLVPGIQLLGGAAGPFLASLIIGNSGVRSVLWVGLVCLLSSLSLLVLVKATAARHQQ